MPGTRRSGGWKSKEWAKYYRPKLRAGEIMCRMALCPNVAERIAHLKPHSKGGTMHMYNLTFLCAACDQLIGDQDATFLGLETVEDMWRSNWKHKGKGRKTSHVSNKRKL